MLLDARTRCRRPAPGWPPRCCATGAASCGPAPRRWSSHRAHPDEQPPPARSPAPRPRLGAMPQLRLALAQVNPTVGRPRRQRRRSSAAGPREAADAGAHLVAFPEMVLTGYPVEDLALRPSFVAGLAGGAGRAGRATWPTTGLGDLAGRRRLPRPARRRPRPTGSGTPAGRAAERRRGAARRPGRRPLRQAPPAQLRGVRRVPLLRARATDLTVVRVARRRRRAGDLRGPLAGRRPGRPGPRGRRRAARW